MKFTFEIEETLIRRVTIEATDEHSAIKELHRQYNDEEIVLTADDHDNTRFLQLPNYNEV